MWEGQAADVTAVLPQVEMCLVATPPQDCDTIAPAEIELGPGETTSVDVIVYINSATCHAVSTDGQATPCPTEATLSLCADFSNGTESGGACDHFHLTVHPFSLVPSSNAVTLQPGEHTTILIQVVRTEGFVDEIALQEAISILDQSINLLYDPNPVTSTDLATVLHIGVGAAADRGTYTVEVSGTGGGSDPQRPHDSTDLPLA